MIVKLVMVMKTLIEKKIKQKRLSLKNFSKNQKIFKFKYYYLTFWFIIKNF